MKFFKQACFIALFAAISLAFVEQASGQLSLPSLHIYQTPEDELVDLAINHRITRLECTNLRVDVDLKLTKGGIVPTLLATKYTSCMDFLTVLENSIKTVSLRMIEVNPPLIVINGK